MPFARTVGALKSFPAMRGDAGTHEATIELALRHFGGLDIAVNNAVTTGRIGPPIISIEPSGELRNRLGAVRRRRKRRSEVIAMFE
jgi:NAD(P)-dependent dehydrogenase (short-subunit alcohol dehydrogenase family)